MYFELDFRNVIVLVSLTIHASLLWVLYRYGRKSVGGRAYSVAILAIVGWIFPMVLYRSHLFGQTLLWARLLYVMASFTSTSFLYFTCVFPNDKKINWKVQSMFAIENILIILLCLHPTLMIKGLEFMDVGEDKILWGPLYPVYSSHISLLFLAGFVILFKKWRKSEGLTRQQILYILVGYFFGANLAMTTNLILPWFGYFELNWLGQFFSTLVAAFTTYAILKHQLLNIKVIATEGLLLVLNIFLFFQFIISDNTRQFFISGIVFIAVLFISYLLLSSVKKEIRRREEIQKLAAELKTANEKLVELDKVKSEFLSIAAHQLRTPLTVIKGYISMIQEGDYGSINNPKIDKVLANVYQSNDHLIRLVTDFLDVTRLEAGRIDYDFQPVDLKKVIDEIIKVNRGRLKEKGLELKLAVDRDLSLVRVDEEKIRHIFFNFLSNAIKYTATGWIKVELFEEKNQAVCQVTDTGIGLSKKDQENIFQKFYRSEGAKRVAADGVGLGLFICRKFIEAHHGEVFAKSLGLGRGSTFGFRLPVEGNEERGKGNEE